MFQSIEDSNQLFQKYFENMKGFEIAKALKLSK